MQLVLILAVLGALVLAQCGPARPVPGAAGRLALVGGQIALVVLFALAVSLATARRLRADRGDRRRVLRRFHRLRQVHGGLWLLATLVAFSVLGWAQLVRFNWHLDGVPLVGHLLILGPVLVPLMLSWAAFYEVERAVQGVQGDPSAAPAAPRSRWRYLALHVRLHLGLLLVPVLGLMTIEDAWDLWGPRWLGEGTEGVILLAALGLLLLLFPLLLRAVWPTRPLEPGPLRERLEAAAARAGVRARDILVWHTDGMVLNAAVAGFVAPLRYILLTDALLVSLSASEIEAVFGHEAGHVRHRHLLLRVLAFFAPLSVWLLVQQVFPAAPERITSIAQSPSLQLAGLEASAAGGLGLLALLGLYVLLVFGLFSRLLEHQADLFACRLVAGGAGAGAPDVFCSALEKLAACCGGGRRARSWQHASIARRVDFLQAACADRKRELRFQRRVRLLGRLVLGIVLSPALYWALLG